MSVLVIDYRAIDRMTVTANSLVKKFQRRIDDLEGITKSVNSIPRSSSNLSNANYFIQKKQQKYQDKINKINGFKQKITEFSAHAQETDKRVASRITADTKTFMKLSNITVNPIIPVLNTLIGIYFPWTKTQWWRDKEAWIADKVRDFKYGIKDWYRKDRNRYLVNIAKGVGIALIIVGVVAITTLSGGSALALLGATAAAKFFTIFTLVSAACSFGYDVAAYNNYKKTHNRLSSNQLDKKGGSDAFGEALGEVGYGIACLRGRKDEANEYKKSGQSLGKITFSGLAIASGLYGLGKIGCDGYKLVKDFSTIKNMGMMEGKSNVDVLKKLIMKKAIGSDYQIKIGALGVNKKFINVPEMLFGKNNTYRKAFFNLGIKNSKGLYKEFTGDGFIEGMEGKCKKIQKEYLKIQDIIKQSQSTGAPKYRFVQ